MKVDVNHKGKVFTDYITKEPVPIIVQTSTNRISGMFHLRKDIRVKDGINDEEQFIAITDATVFDCVGEVEQYRSAFLTLNRDSIIWLIPQEELIAQG
jgi:hypothetical protein